MRWSAASAYLRPALDRSNVSIESQVMVTRILFDGLKAVGVEYVQNGETKKAMAEQEVIVSGGAINSPQILMLSGKCIYEFHEQYYNYQSKVSFHLGTNFKFNKNTLIKH